MNRRFPVVRIALALAVALAVAFGFRIVQARAQATEDTAGSRAPRGRMALGGPAHYSTNFPLAAPAGTDSNALQQAPPGAVDQGPIGPMSCELSEGCAEPKTWKFGSAFNPPPDAKLWNPVMIKMKEGGKVTGGTVFSADTPQTYCAMANAGYDFIWTEMQHSPRDWEEVARMWAACPHARAVPGVRLPLADEHDIQQAVDLGALVVVIPTTRSYQQALQARNWAFFPPLGNRSQGGGQAETPAFWANVPGGYRQTINDNLVMIDMIETFPGLMQAKEIASIPGVTAIFAASGDLGNRSGYRPGSPDYERLINIVHDAALAEHKRLCGPISWLNRPDFTCFQAGSEDIAIMRGVADELGPLKDTQPVPEVGPYSKENQATPYKEP